MLARQTFTRFLSVVLISFAVLLSFNSCSKKKSKPAPAAVENPWNSAGGGSITPEIENRITETVRVLAFDDGVVISYDGSDADPEDQEVCREEEHDGQEIKVCMDLEDDGLPPSTTSTTPLTGSDEVVGYEGVDSFSDVLTCYVDGVRQFNCNAVFETISDSVGDDFTCEANLYNGDKALSCSDNWAITVNGDDDDQEKTICRINTADGRGRCLSAPRQDDQGQDIPVEELITEMQQTTWAGYESENINNAQILGSDGALEALEFVDSPGMGTEIAFEVVQTDTNGDGAIDANDLEVCTVDANSGQMTPDAANTGTCKIRATVVAEGFVDRVFVVEMEVVEANTTDWAGYGTPSPTGFYPEEVSAGWVESITAPVASPSYRYISLTAPICTVNDQNGMVTAVTPGECEIQLDASADGFLDVRIRQTVTVDDLEGFTSITWTNWSSNTTGAVVGTDIDFGSGTSGNAPVADPVANATEITTSGSCRWDDTSGSEELSFHDNSECVVTVTVSLRGYSDFSETFTVTPTAAAQTVEQQMQYRGSLRVGGELAIYAAPTSSAGVASIVYTALGRDSGDTTDKADVCSVDEHGTVTAESGASTGDICRITATLQAPGRTDVDSDPVDLVLTAAAGTQTAPSGWSDPYGAAPEVEVGARSNPPSTPTSSGTGALDYRVQAGSEGCTVHHSTGVVTGVNTNGGCVIEAQYLGDEDTSPSPWAEVATITIIVGDQPPPMPANSGDVYANNSGASCSGANSVQLDATSAGPCWPLPGNMNMGGDLELRAWDDADPDSGAEATACSVSDEGEVTGLEVAGDCFIHARFVAVANRFNETDWVNISGGGITIANGAMTGITWSLSQKTAKVGDELTLDPVDLGEHSDADVTYAVDTDGSTGCAFDTGDPVALRTLKDFSTAGTCRVKATVTKTDYNDLEITDSAQVDLDIVVTAAVATDLTFEWSGYNPSSITWGDETPTLETVTLSHDDDTTTQVFSSETSSVCTVTADGGALTILTAGTCQIKLTATTGSRTGERVVAVYIAHLAQAELAATNLYSATSIRVGETADLTSAFTASGQGNLEVRTTDVNICTVAPLDGLNAGRVTGVGGGTCQVQARWSGNDHYAPSNWASIAGADGIEIAAADQTAPTAWEEPYGFNPSVRVGSSIDLRTSNNPLIPPAPPTGGGTYEYGVKSGERHCEVIPTAGLVAGLLQGSCVIQVRYSNNDDYNASPWTELATINILPARALILNSVPTLAYAPSDLQIGRATSSDPTALPTTDQNSVGVFWQYRVQGLRGGVATDNVCALSVERPLYEANSDGVVDDQHPDHGKITVGADAEVGDICEVGVVGFTQTGGNITPGYLSYLDVESIELTVLIGTQTLTATDAYSTDAITGNAASSPNPITNTAPGGGAIAYRVCDAQDAASCTTSTVCQIDANGVVRALGSTAGQCWVHAQWVAVANKYAESTWVNISDTAGITTTLGTLDFTTSGGTPPTYTNPAANGAVSPSSTAGADHNSITVTFSNWQVDSDDGADGTYDGDTSVCTINSVTGEVTANGASVNTGDKCKITATASADGFADVVGVEIAEITIQ